MKRSLSLVLSILLTLALMLSMIGCGEQSKFIGKWEADVDMAKFINDGMAQAGSSDITKYIELDDFGIVFVMEFNEDGTYKMYIDEDSAKDAFEDAKEAFVDGMTEYFEDYIKDMGLGMTVEEVLAASGTDLEDAADQAYGDAMLKSLMDETEKEGNFKVKDGKLFLSDGKDKNVDEKIYDTYEINDDELKLIKSYGSDDEDANALYPMTFERVD